MVLLLRVMQGVELHHTVLQIFNGLYAAFVSDGAFYKCAVLFDLPQSGQSVLNSLWQVLWLHHGHLLSAPTIHEYEYKNVQTGT